MVKTLLFIATLPLGPLGDWRLRSPSVVGHLYSVLGFIEGIMGVGKKGIT